MNPLPFRTLLYRFFFFGWLFRKVDQHSNLFERAATERYNQQQAGWLPSYMLRWLWLALAFYFLGQTGDLIVEAPTVARWCYAFSAMCVGFTVTVVIAWLGLTQRAQIH